MSGHVVPFPAACTWCDAPAFAETTCPASVRCPRCRAREGQPCRAPNGHARTKLHRERWQRAASIDAIGGKVPSGA